VITHLVASGYAGTEVEDVSYGYVYSFGGRVGYIVPLAVASLIVTSEYRSGQIARSIVILRGRDRAFAADVVTAALAGSVLGAVFATLAHLASGAVFALNGQESRFATPRHLAMYGGILALGVLWSAIGAGLAWLVRNQTAVIGGVLASRCHADAVAHLELGDAGANLRDGADELVTGNERVGHGTPLATGGVDVGVADARVSDVEVDLPLARFADVDLQGVELGGGIVTAVGDHTGHENSFVRSIRLLQAYSTSVRLIEHVAALLLSRRLVHRGLSQACRVPGLA